MHVQTHDFSSDTAARCHLWLLYGHEEHTHTHTHSPPESNTCPHQSPEHRETTGHFPTQLGAINNPCVEKGNAGRGVGSVMNPSAGRLSATRDETARRACVSLCQFHLRSGRGRSHQGSLCSRGVLGRLLRRCCDTHAWLEGWHSWAWVTVVAAAEAFDGRDRMFTCKWLLSLDKGVRAMT